jgi:hypothetical protein
MAAGLSRLDVSGNQVASLASLPHLPDLEYLDLSRDQFIRCLRPSSETTTTLAKRTYWCREILYFT